MSESRTEAHRRIASLKPSPFYKLTEEECKTNTIIDPCSIFANEAVSSFCESNDDDATQFGKKETKHQKSYWKTKSLQSVSACKVCGEICKDSDMDKHLEIHSGVRPHVCRTCGKGFKNNYALRDHMITHIGKHFLCEQCGQRLAAKSVYRHRRVCSDMRLQVVEAAKQSMVVNSKSTAQTTFIKNNQRWKRDGELIDNLLEQINEKIKSETPSTNATDSSKILTQGTHHKTTDENDSLSQFSCEATKARKKSLPGKSKTKTSAEPVFDMSCVNVSKSKRLSTGTAESGMEERKFVCPFCSKRFKRKDHLKDHCETHITTKRFLCKLCTKRFATEKKFEKHRRQTHAGEGSFELLAASDSGSCESVVVENSHKQDGEINSEVIDKLFGRRVKDPGLENRRLLYPICGNKFKRQHHLKEHSVTHVAVKQYQCQLCSKQFPSQRYFDTHNKKMHAGEGRFVLPLTQETRDSENSENKREDKKQLLCDFNKLKGCSALKSYVCEICGRLFEKTWHLKVHNTFVHDKKDGKKYKLKCSFCYKSFHSINELFRHKKLFHFCLKQHMCAVCGCLFKSKRELLQHAKMRKKMTNRKTVSGSLFSCEFCRAIFATRKEIQQHVQIHKTNSLYSCVSCKKNFEDNVQLYQHCLVHAEISLSCSLCKRSFPTKTALLVHIKAHTLLVASIRNKFAFKKLTCSLKASTKQEQIGNTDTSVVFSEKNFICPKCDSQFETKTEFDLHIQTQTEKIAFPCDQCRCSFISMPELNSHVTKVHYSDKMHDTLYSQKSASTMLNALLKVKPDFPITTSHISNLINSSPPENTFRSKCFRRKVKTVSKDRPFECGVCGFSFGSKHHLRDHVIRHTGEKSFHCSLCDKYFYLVTCLRRHEKQAHGIAIPKREQKLNPEDRPYKCSYCDKSFKYRGGWRDHEGIHLKPFICYFCAKGYPTKYLLKQHEYTHSKTNSPRRFKTKTKKPQKKTEPRYTCETCGKKFQQNFFLKEHILSEHKKEIAFFCPICHKGFFNQTAVRKHKKKHTDHPRLCELCGKIFYSYSGLRKHRMKKICTR